MTTPRFVMTNPIEQVIFQLTYVKADLQNIKRNRCVCFGFEMEPNLEEGFDQLYKKLEHSQSMLLTYFEAMKHSRREKRNRYRKNVRARKLQML